MFFCSVEMLPDWAICKEDTLQFCLICVRIGAYLWRGAFPHNAANQFTSRSLLLCQTFLYPWLRVRQLKYLSESCTSSLNPVFWNLLSDLVLSPSFLAASFSHGEGKGCSWVILTSFWQQYLGGKKARIVSNQLEVFWGFLGRHWMGGLQREVIFSSLHLWDFL